jgi:hypothetical protein
VHYTLSRRTDFGRCGATKPNRYVEIEVGNDVLAKGTRASSARGIDAGISEREEVLLVDVGRDAERGGA